ncbi:hypothetical protein GCM10010990_22090 [Croceicoccus mobilis]|uniref:Uncharacterized protein n=1 Tax=Croceicoccus mobilis TaxID=1703339 RepID=A0A916Z1J6_9SPHN|nr:hypothetical protein GCM10010990_22090 [Croceicoccus mobilis]
MDSDLPDFTIMNGQPLGPVQGGVTLSSRGGGQRVASLRKGGCLRRAHDAKAGADALERLGASLSPAARRACAERVKKRGLARLSGDSDPCICGEPTLLAMVASSLPGRAPVDAFKRFGGPQ